jgi:hypothetical protein
MFRTISAGIGRGFGGLSRGLWVNTSSVQIEILISWGKLILIDVELVTFDAPRGATPHRWENLNAVRRYQQKRYTDILRMRTRR